MPAVTSRRAVCLAAAVVVALLVGGCADQAADSPAGAAPGTTASTIPTTTTIPPLTTEEVAWLDALTKMKETFEKKRDKVLRAGTAGVSRALEALLGKTVGACSRDLARVGPPPSDRLQPVSTLANKACQQFTKAARCHATVVRLSLPSGGVVVGSPQERPWKQASRCAQTAGDEGLELLSQAAAKGVEIQVQTG
jgi:hypothetical protein